MNDLLPVKDEGECFSLGIRRGERVLLKVIGVGPKVLAADRRLPITGPSSESNDMTKLLLFDLFSQMFG